MATAQINVRLDDSLKAKGDRALARAGYSTTQAVRALWQLAANLAGDPDGITKILSPLDERESASELRQRRLEAAREGANLFENALAAIGVAQASAAEEELSYRELRERALAERLQERGLDQ